MTVRFVELPGGGELAAAVAGIRDDLVCVVPPGTGTVDPAQVEAIYAALDARVVLAASPEPCGSAPPVEAPTPYRYVAPAVIGPPAALGALGRGDADSLARAYLGGADLELDVFAELFLVRDGTGTDAVAVGDGIIATATGTTPAVVIGGIDDLPRPAEFDMVVDYARGTRAAQPAEVVAPEILSTGFWTPEMCLELIRAAEVAGDWGSDVDDPVPGLEVSLRVLHPGLFAHVEDHLARSVFPRWREVWPDIAWNGLHDAFVIKYVAGTEVSNLPLHHDVAQISASVRLNTGYSGGALEFPRQSWDNAAVAVGDLVAWPSLVTHPHRSTSVTRGVKYGLTLWLRIPN